MIDFFRKRKIFLLVIKVLIGIIVFAILVERLLAFESISSQSSINNLENAIWYSIVTLTTVGYGDMYPVTLYGRAIGYIFLFTSLGLYAILIGFISSFMNTITENKKLGYNGTNMEGHAIIIGWNEFGKMVTDQLHGVGKEVVIVTDNKDSIDTIREQYNHSNRIFTLFSDHNSLETLKKANISKSSIILVNLDNDTEKLVYILNLKKMYGDDLEYVVTLDNANLKHTFLTAGVSNAISKNEIASKLLASYMFEPDVASYSEGIMTFTQNDADYDIKQFLVTPDNPYLGKPYQDVFFDMKKRYNSILLGISKVDKYGKRKLIKNPLGELNVGMGDYLIILINGKAFKIIQKVFNVEEGYFKNRG
jgi:voltage-gated potassium channel